MPKFTPENVEVTGQVPPNMRDRYTARVKESTFGLSRSSQNPMITLKCEIVTPNKKTINGKTYVTAGLEFTVYLTLTAKAVGQVLDMHTRLGLPAEIDSENPNTEQYKGLVFDAIISSRERIAQKPDPENPGKFIPITDANDKPISQGWEINCNASDVLGIGVVPIANL